MDLFLFVDVREKVAGDAAGVVAGVLAGMVAGVAAGMVAGVETGRVADPRFPGVHAVAAVIAFPINRSCIHRQTYDHALAKLVGGAVAAA